MGDFLISWYTTEDKWNNDMLSRRFTNVSEDYVDGFILALEDYGVAKGSIIKERLGD